MTQNNIVEVNMTQELANELHAKGIYFDAASPTQLTNIAGQSFITVTAHFTENKRSSEAWWQVKVGTSEKRANSLSEAVEVLRSYGLETKLDRALWDLAVAIRLNGRDAEINNDDHFTQYYNKKLSKSVIFEGKPIDVFICGVYPCYCFEGKWTFNLLELLAWLGIKGAL